MKELTKEELAMVASTVTGRVAKAYDCVIVSSADRNGYEIWNPSFTKKSRALTGDICLGSLQEHGCQAEQQAQALACVEWLFDWLLDPKKEFPMQQWNYRDMAIRIGHAIRDKDTTALQRMVLELKEPK